MDNFLTRLVKRTLGLTPVVQPTIASLFAPTEVVLGSYSSGFEIENKTTEPFWGGESVSTFSPEVPVRSIFPQIDKQGNYIHNQPDLNISRAQKDEFTIPFGSNFNKKNISTFSQKPNPTLPDNQPNAFNIIPPNYAQEVTPSQKKSEDNLDLVEPLVKSEIEPERQTETQSLNVQPVRSQLDTNPQQKDTPIATYINDVSRSENPLRPIKSLVERIFQPQQQRDNTLSSPHERVELPANPLLSNLNPQSPSSNTTAKVSSVQPIASGIIQAHSNIEKPTLPTAHLKINDPVNLPPEISIAIPQSNSAISEQVKKPSLLNSQITELPLVDSEVMRKVQPDEKFTPNQVEHINDNQVTPAVQSRREITNLNPARNYPKENNLTINQQDTQIPPSTTLNYQQPQTSAEMQSVNRGIPLQQLIQLVPRQSPDKISTASEPINHKQNSQTLFLYNSQLDQPFVLPSQQHDFIQLGNDAIPDKQENPNLGNNKNPEIKPYPGSIANKFIPQPTPIVINSKLKVNQKSDSEPQTRSDLSISEKERVYEREFAFLTRRSLSVLSQSSSRQSGIDPIPNKLPEFRQLNSSNRREVANAARTVWQNESHTETTIQITIGRIEVRANNPPTSSTLRNKSTQRGPTLSLQDYLKQRQGEK